ncbi:hypothetical protein F4806DRAFT_117997 [Annulohypoxylon nitens]|nr:hypothetical protein F4806DRAFT_117997 [Annulohypoxylon nitens]
MASINTCSEEILMMFVDYVYHQSPKSLDNLSLVNKRFCKLVAERRLRSWTFRHGNLSEDLDIIEDENAYNKIRRVSLMDYMAVKPQFLAAAAKMEMLRDIEMVSGFCHKDLQNTFIKFLQGRPEIRLHLKVVSERRRHASETENVVLLQRFAGCTNLHSLSVEHTYCNPPQCDAMTRPLKTVLLTCTNLRHLKININKVHPVENFYCGFGFVNGERIAAALETLQIISYPFGKQDSASPHLYQPNTPGYPSVGYEQFYWTRNFDWSNLTQLNIRDTWAWIPHVKKLTSLKEVDLSNDPCTVNPKFFLANVRPELEVIKVHQMKRPGWESIARHGKTLRVLHFTGEGRQNIRALMQICQESSELESIRDNCPHIEDLGVCIDRFDHYPIEYLHLIAEFKKVTKVTLYFDYTKRNFTSRKLQPAVTFEGASRVFSDLRGFKWCKNKYYPIREVRLVSGLFHPPKNLEITDTSEQHSWTEDSLISIVVKADEEETRRHRGPCIPSCSELTEHENVYLRVYDWMEHGLCKAVLSTIPRSTTEPRLKKVSPKFKVACNGPMTFRKWLDAKHWIYDRKGTAFFKDNDGMDWVIEDEDDWHELKRSRYPSQIRS